MDQNEILMTLLSKACHNFWKESREVVLKKSIINKRKIVVNPLTDHKRLRLIKLQKMYKYIDVSLHIGTEEIELTTFEYFIFFLANPSLLGRFGNEYPNFKEICYDFELQEPIQNIFVREESIQEDDLNKVREVLFDAFTINEVSVSEYYQNPKHTIIGSLDPDEDKKAKKKRLKDLQGLVTTREKVKILKIDRDDFNQFESGKQCNCASVPKKTSRRNRINS
ncbi:unnamed protein product [Moneuplotes crassus]|uniref:Uncharacterized protein n=1 Tax=Euplotes crassus TaxID=5936 RepID=A0AAD1UA51_EUPCR|nr:unnamed protein product [Moneuplotes crassus]